MISASPVLDLDHYKPEWRIPESLEVSWPFPLDKNHYSANMNGSKKSGACGGERHLLSSILAMSVEKIRTLKETIQFRAGLRKAGRRLVFTNGCFDILHLGHVRYLNQARSLGDALAVGLNSDRSVREIKGEARPIIPEKERAEVLAALSCVDCVFIFDDVTPKRVIEAIVPDVLVKGADWDISEIVGRDTVENTGGIVVNVPLVEGSSTSQIIRRVLERFGKMGGQAT